ncbi:MAG: AMP-binding protein [Desulfobacterales bacterium]|nr:AMP-binding protein [Desulfobacterales bacterium]
MLNCNIAQSLSETARRYPERIALVMPAGRQPRSWTFAELDRIADGFALALKERGVSQQDRVLLMVKPSLEFIALTFALFKLGAVIILIDPGMGYKNLRRCVARVAPTVFVGIPRAHLFKTLFPAPFATVRTSICVGNSCGLFGRSFTADRLGPAAAPFAALMRDQDDPAAILFTTGSTGPPKGVCYPHGVFAAQLRLIQEYYGINAADIDQPVFPLFALFSIALGATVVVPDMDPTRPARVDPVRFIRSIREYRATYSFGSPALWNVVSRYCLEQNIRLDSLKKILMAGAPVSGELIGRVRAIMAEDGEVHTPYGATECLPIASITGSEILDHTWEKTRTGAGTCVGRPLPGITIRVIPVCNGPIREWDESMALPVDEIGEIVVKGPVVTRAYDHNDQENQLAKIGDNGETWHRIGDLGYLDDQGRLWFCGRKAHRVRTPVETLYTVCCEAIFNEHPAVFRSALVGLGPAGHQVPVLIVELHDSKKRPARLEQELRKLAGANPLTRGIDDFLVHPAFPVDIRHNAKIFREKLAVWAAARIRGQAL